MRWQTRGYRWRSGRFEQVSGSIMMPVTPPPNLGAWVHRFAFRRTAPATGNRLTVEAQALTATGRR